MRNVNDYLVDNVGIEPIITVYDNVIAQQQIEETEFDGIDVDELSQDVLDELILQNSDYKDRDILLPEILSVKYDDASIPFRGPMKEDLTLVLTCLSNSWSPWHGGHVFFYSKSEVCEIISPSPGRIACVESPSWMQIQPPTTSATEELVYLKFFIK